ncbi:hypothetical protein [Citrobacter sp. wls714]|uniref:hypothetical protein n=1 Tax=Citrobacter sp. wls714 TaxID=2576422 RepID=UPI0010C9AB67|nr:hypothetical protein [Citrobacter sp. wls714]TKU48078.1 hypothetical protein FDX11_10225 [Citrobacter sp. wls714]
MTLYEMEGFLRGKCLPGDMKVNESNAQYLVRKFSELQSQNAELAVHLANAESKCRELAEENVTLNDKMNKLATWPGIEFYSSAWEFCNLDGNDALEFMCDVKTPATDAFLAEVRASAIPEGYVLVPQQIFLEPSDIESICSQCGDGHESGYGDFTDGLLWVGNIQRDDGSIVHGLHISSADYTEEGGVTVCEFAAQLRKGAAL